MVEAPDKKAELLAAWRKRWREADFTWDGLKKHKLQGWVVADGLLREAENGRVYGQPILETPQSARGAEASLQDYWRADPATGQLRDDTAISAELIAVSGRPTYHVAHLPLEYDDGAATGKEDWAEDALNALTGARLAVASETKWEGEERNIVGCDHAAQFAGCVLAKAPTHPNGKDHPLSLRLNLALIFLYCDFAKAKFSGDAWFDKAAFSGGASFGEAAFSGGASFSEAAFGAANFTKATFSGVTVFELATFGGAANFLAAAFGGGASFTFANFSDIAQFLAATFNGAADFTAATFNGVGAEFARTIFGGEALFEEARFSGAAGFYMATFSGAARFDGATIGGAARFSSATFSDAAGFAGATFSSAALFEGATFSDAAGFARATFSGEALFNDAKFQGDMDLLSAVFERRASFENIAWPKTAAHYHSAFDQVLFRSTLSLRGSGLKSFAAFDGARLEGGLHIDDPDEKTTGDTFNAERKAAIAASLTDGEVFESKLKSVQVSQAEIRSHVTSQREARLRELERGCRVLKLAFERAANKSREQMLYRFELRARRAQRNLPLGEALFSDLYALASDYGASMARPFVALALLIVLFGAIFLGCGYTRGVVGADAEALNLAASQAFDLSWANVFKPLSALNGEAAEQGTLANALLNDPTPWASATMRAIATLQSLLAIVLAFLFALAVRRRFQIS